MRAKTDLFPPDLARLAILQTLAARETCVCGELVEALPLAQATVSQHLKALKAAGLVRGGVDGPRSCYCVDGAALRELAGGLADLFGPILAALPDDGADCDDDCC